MSEAWILAVLLLTNIDCDDPRFLCSVVERGDVAHVSLCAYPSVQQGMFQPMPWKKWEYDGKTLWIQTTNCTGT